MRGIASERTFLPCPQLSLLGAFSPTSASPSKAHQLLLALAPSVLLMAMAVLLNAQEQLFYKAF